MDLWKLLSMAIILALLTPAWTGAVLGNAGSTGDSAGFSPDKKEDIQHRLSRMKGWFTENKGQIENPEVRFVYSGSPAFGFVECGYLLKITGEDNRTAVVKVKFEGASPVSPKGSGMLEHGSSYFVGNDSSKWRTDVPNYQKVVYKNLYDGIDLVFYTTENGLKYDFIVSPGSDPEQICWSYTGAEGVSVDEKGRLHVETKAGEFVEQAPWSYQMKGEEKVEVESGYIVENKGVRFEAGDYDRGTELVIDPLVYSTFVGGGPGWVGWTALSFLIYSGW